MNVSIPLCDDYDAMVFCYKRKNPLHVTNTVAIEIISNEKLCGK